MTESSDRERFLAATCDLPSVRLSEIVLRTSNYEEMKDWYQAVLGVDPYLSDDKFCFRRLHLDYPYGQVLAIFNVPEVVPQPGYGSGLDHIQLRHGSLGELLERYDRLQAVGITPDLTMNHGPGHSFYYRDPDGNRVELSAPNFDDEDEYLAFIVSEAFQKDIAGVPVDPDDVVARYRSGVPRSELVKF